MIQGYMFALKYTGRVETTFRAVTKAFSPAWHCSVHAAGAYLELNFDCTRSCIMLVLERQPCSAVWLIRSSNTLSSKDGRRTMSGANLFVCFDRMLEKSKPTKLTSGFSQQTAPCVFCVCACMLPSGDTHVHLCLCKRVSSSHKACAVLKVFLWKKKRRKKKEDPALSASIAASISAAIKLDFPRSLQPQFWID